MRLIDLELRTSTVWISFKYDERVVATVRTLPERTFDARTRRWSVPLDHLPTAIAKLEPLHFKFSPRLREYWNQVRDKVVIEELPAEADAKDEQYTVSVLNEAVRQILVSNFRDAVWLVGELEGFDRNRADGHAYFELVERSRTKFNRNARNSAGVVARVDAVMFGRERSRIEQMLADQAPEITLRDGLAVRVQVKVEMYAPQGRFQVIVEDLDPDYTTGALQKNRDRILAALKKRGIIERNRALRLPTCPLRVGLITSDGSDAYNDFIEELRRSGYPFEVSFCHATMQGDGAEASILRALRHFSELADELDVLAIVRGGGSRSDLAYLDTDAIGAAVCNCPVKVVVGVGHHRDQSILDFIAHSEKTPTAAAQCLVARLVDLETRLEDASRRVAYVATASLERARGQLDRCAMALERRASSRVTNYRTEIERRASRFSQTGEWRMRAATLRLEEGTRRLERATRERLSREKSRMEYARRLLTAERLEPRLARFERSLEDARRRLDGAVRRQLREVTRELHAREEQLRLVDPRRVLERGFAIVRVAGRVVEHVQELEAGVEAELELQDGRVTVRVESQKEEA